eukprot:COSAG06_NODE_2547_length_6695_cov_5.498636_6_plen_183_part_00
MRFPAQAADPVERFKNGWYDCESAAAFILNIPSRFDFEVALHEARAEGTISSPEDMSNLMVTAWRGAKHKKRAPFSHYENPIICQGRLGTNIRQRLHKTQHLALSCCSGRYGDALQVRKPLLFVRFYIYAIVLPRQARDKHRKNSKKRLPCLSHLEGGDGPNVLGVEAALLHDLAAVLQLYA